jgi:hypothetical protein
MRMNPPFQVGALWVFAHKQIVGPLIIGELLGILRTNDMCLTPMTELMFITIAAPRTFY